MRLLLTALLFCLAAFGSSPALAREEILSFDIDVTVRKDGDLLVEENITVRAEGNEIRRGIYRDIPIGVLDDWGFWSKKGFDIVSIQQGGRDSPYHTETYSQEKIRFLRIYIGDADTYLSPGNYAYTLVYRTSRQLRYFAGFDEIYWNATGNFWTFPIRGATARVHLPEGAVAEQAAAYTGAYGASGGNYRSNGLGTESVSFSTTRALAPGEGLTIAVGFTKGVVPERSIGDGLTFFLDNFGVFVFAIGWIGVAAYFLVTWYRIGRDPPGETVIPLYHPPEGFSPAALSYLHFQEFKQIRRGSSRPLIGALLSLGVKKHIRIEEDAKGVITFHRLRGSTEPLSNGEAILIERLFGGGDKVTMNKAAGVRLISAHAALERTIKREYGDRFFRSNITWFVVGAIAAAVVTVLSLILQQPPDEGGVAIIAPVIFSALGWFGAFKGGAMLTASFPIGFQRLKGAALMAGAMVLLLIGLGLSQVSGLAVYGTGGVIIFAGVGGIIAFRYLLRAPTPLGAKIFSRIEGFMLYLTTAETDRLNLRDAPEMSEELFERYLPYAVALGVEKPWSDAFSAYLARFAPGEAAHTYQPAWYTGRNWSSASIGRVTGSAMAAMSSSIAAAMPAPKSSSGSGGGGFSGGGGGGGGGGGW
ncbi:MAG: DUF2207 domain-containing protein [Flavobacteriaceae bacterium]